MALFMRVYGIANGIPRLFYGAQFLASYRGRWKGERFRDWRAALAITLKLGVRTSNGVPQGYVRVCSSGPWFWATDSRSPSTPRMRDMV